MSRYARQIDANQRRVIAVLRAHGASVEAIQGARAGVPDLLVGFRGVTRLVEVKPLVSETRRRELRETQEAWHRQWRGSPVCVVRTDADAVELLRDMEAR